MTQVMAYTVPRLVCLVGFYITVEETFVKWVFGAGQLGVIVRQCPDVVIMGLASAIILARLAEFRWPVFSSPTPVWIALFATYAIVVIALSNGDLLYSALSLKAFLRYAMLFVLVHYFPFDARCRQFLWRTMVAAIAVQAIVCAWQYVGGESVRDLLVPENVVSRDPRFSKIFTGARFEGVNDLVGTMGNNIGLSYFLVFVLAVWLARTPHSLVRWCGVLVFISWNILTGSRAGVLASTILVLVHEGRRLSSGARFLLIVTSAPIALFALMVMAEGSEKGSLLFALNPAYLREAVNQRLGLIMYLVPQLAFSPVVFVGLGPDKFQYPYFFEEIGIYLPSILLAVIPNVIEDVYWVAIVVSYGLIGSGLFAVALLSAWVGLGNRDRAHAGSGNWVRTAGKLMILASLVLALFSQVFHLRQFSYFFWLFLAIGLQRRIRRPTAAGPSSLSGASVGGSCG